MPRQLLVGVARVDRLDEPRRYLLDLLGGLEAIGVDIQVALFADGPVRRDLERLADVRLVPDLPARSLAGLAQSAARRGGVALADRVHDLRTTETRRWIRPPDCIHVHGPEAVDVLRYVRTPDVAVTSYAHEHDFSIAGLSPLDRDRLLARTDRFFATGDRAVSDLVAAGVQRSAIEAAPSPLRFPAPPISGARRAEARRACGLEPDATVVAVPPVADWADAPDLTLAVAWEVERLAGAAAPKVLWYAMPGPGAQRWPIDYDIERMGLRSVHLTEAAPASIHAFDLVVLPIRTTAVLPETLAEEAAAHRTPILCWEGHPLAAEVQRWGGEVIERGDVEAMARRVAAVCTDPDQMRAARAAGWHSTLADVERITPLAVPAP